MLYSDFTFWLYSKMETLSEPTRFFAYFGLVVGSILLCVGLVWLDRKLEARKIRKARQSVYGKSI